MSAEIIKIDPVVALSARSETLDAQCAALDEGGDGAAAYRVSRSIVEIENRIAELVPTLPAGFASQVRLLVQWGQAFDWSEPLDQLADKVLAGLARIGEARS